MAEKYTLSMIVGSTFKKIFRFLDQDENPIDLSGYKADVSIRKDLKCKEPFISLSSEEQTKYGSELVIDSTAGEVLMIIDADETEKISNIYEKQSYKWDLRLEDPYGEVYIYFPSSDFEIIPVSTRFRL